MEMEEKKDELRAGLVFSLGWLPAAPQPITHPNQRTAGPQLSHQSPREVKPLNPKKQINLFLFLLAHSFSWGSQALQFFFFLHSAHSEELKWKEKRELSERLQIRLHCFHEN